jgi:hypothetical protein
MQQTTIWTSAAILVFVAIIGGSIMAHNITSENPFAERAFGAQSLVTPPKWGELFADRNILTKGLNRPTLWLFYDSSETNARSWSDFMARSSHALNLPYLNLAYESIVRHNGQDFNVEALVGIESVAEKLGGWEQIPEPMRRPAMTFAPHHIAWIRAAILKKYGGLWVDPSIVSLAPFAPICDPVKPVFFGTDQTVLTCGVEGTAVPDFRVIWVPQAEHKIFSVLEDAARRVVMQGGGGAAARYDDKWAFIQYVGIAEDPETTVILLPQAELARNGANMKRLQAEDFLAAGSEGQLHFAVPSTALYVAFPLDEIRRRRTFGWFLRESEDQILSADLAITHLLKMSLSK